MVFLTPNGELVELPSTLSCSQAMVQGSLGRILVGTDPDHGSVQAIWVGGSGGEDGSNYVLGGNGLTINLNAKTALNIRINDSVLAVVTSNGFAFSSPLVNQGYLVASLPDPATVTYGRTFVVDCVSTTFNDLVVGSGSNKVPVHSDGTNWRVG